jgi:lipopolysaccharide transport system permease protein
MKSGSNDNVLIIAPGLADRHYWRDLWRYRELFYVLAWRDISVRYKQTIIGVLWTLLRPLITMLVFTLVFSRIANLPSEGGVPYALMVFAGLLPWQFFSTALAESSNSLIDNSNLISKVYFPRLIVPTASIVVTFVDFLMGFVILLGLMIWYQFAPSWQIFTLPFFVALAFFASLGPGLWIASLNVKYRDFRYAVPFFIQIGLYISPVGFSSSLVPIQWKFAYYLNPMVGIIDGFRWSILGGKTPLYWEGLLLSFAVVLFLLWVGVNRFRQMEKSFADLI